MESRSVHVHALFVLLEDQGIAELRDDVSVKSRLVLALGLFLVTSTLAGCQSKAHDSSHADSSEPPAPVGRFHCPSADFVSDSVDFEVTQLTHGTVCQYSLAGDPLESRSLEVIHERWRYQGRSLASVQQEIIKTLNLAGLDLFDPFPEGGPDAFVFTTSGPACTYWVYASDGVPTSVEAMNGAKSDCDSASRLAEAIALH